MTHDSIGLGEDGPTHQPVEHLAALRCIPNLRTFRPCDAVETAECWQAALERTDGPTVLCLTRQNLVQARTKNSAENLSAQGGYELLPAEGGKAQVSIFASGSEVEIAVNARKLLMEKGVHARVVSVPSMELLLSQDEATQKAVIGTAPVRIAVEAGSALRLGRHYRRSRPVCRHDRLRRVGPGERPLQTFRNHRGSCCRFGHDTA